VKFKRILKVLEEMRRKPFEFLEENHKERGFLTEKGKEREGIFRNSFNYLNKLFI